MKLMSHVRILSPATVEWIVFDIDFLWGSKGIIFTSVVIFTSTPLLHVCVVP